MLLKSFSSLNTDICKSWPNMNLLRCHSSLYFEGRKIQKRAHVNESKPCKSWDGNMKPKQSTCLLELRAVFCILATLCEAHVEAMTKTQRRCKKRRAKLFNSRFHKHTEKYATFSLFFNFYFWICLVSTVIFAKKKFAQANVLKS